MCQISHRRQKSNDRRLLTCVNFLDQFLLTRTKKDELVSIRNVLVSLVIHRPIPFWIRAIPVKVLGIGFHDQQDRKIFAIDHKERKHRSVERQNGVNADEGGQARRV